MLCRQLLSDLTVVACQVAEFTLVAPGNKTSFKQTGTQELAYPRGILLVSLSTWNIPDVALVNYHDTGSKMFITGFH